MKRLSKTVKSIETYKDNNNITHVSIVLRTKLDVKYLNKK